MNTGSINSLWSFLQTLSLTRSNKEWLAERLIESSKNDVQNYTIEELDEHLFLSEQEFSHGDTMTMEEADLDMKNFIENL